MRLEVIDNHRTRFVPVPTGWHQRTMRFAVQSYQTKKNEDENPTVLSLTKSGLKVKTDLSFGKSTENYVGHQIVEQGQFVFTPRDFDATPILCGVADTPGCISNLYIVFNVSRQIDPRFLEYYFWGLKHGFDFFEKLSFGMRYSFNRTQFENIPLLHPDLATQRQIADFLDRETARIDLLIEKKQKLVALLGERKIIELEKLLFESGFGIRKLRREARVISKGTTPSTIGAEMVDDGVRFLKAENVTWNGVTTSPENFISEETHRALKRSSLQSGDVLVVIAGATTGKTAVMPSGLAPANTNQAVSFVRLKEPRYAEIVCAAIGCRRIQRDILLTSVQSAQPNLSMEDLGNLMLPFPDEAEISTVFEKVTTINLRSATLIAATEKSIDRLKEYRSALITTAVTGKIDVTIYAKSGAAERRLDAVEEVCE